MMAKKFYSTIFLLLVTSYLLLVTDCFAQPLSSTELIDNAKLYDGKTVSYAGEVIGEIMARGNFAWVNVNDGQNAIGIWMSKALSSNIIYAGGYKAKGDLVEVVGVFHRACPEHGGDLDIHAQGLRRLSSGKEVLEKLNLSKRNMSLALLGILCLVLILRQLKQA
jgi:hypothetical protein